MNREVNCKIVVVDNEEIDRFIIERCLALFGLECEVLEFADALKALEYFKGIKKSEEGPDLVITDMKIDDADGFEIITSIRQNPSLTNTPIVAMTSYPAAFAQERALALGADLFFIKPPSTEIMEKIGGLIMRKKQHAMKGN
jgi:two-component system chemotaxis response regulator CheY